MSLLTINNLRKSYRTPDGGRATVVDVEQFALRAQQHLALRGESGSGKTTFLNLIAGILKPDDGSIVLDGADIARMGEANRDALRAANIGYIFQTFNLLQGYTALQNVELAMSFGRGVDRMIAKQLLVDVGLAERMHYRPQQLSVGQQQRVAVARALANHPRLVLADEPTGNLDTRRAGEALAIIRELCTKNGAALLLVSHSTDVLNQFDDVVDFHELNRAFDGDAQDAQSPTGTASL